jgi:uncharacterized phage-associated protein
MENSIAIQANKEKIGTLLAYIGEKIPNLKLRKLIKLVFLIDERSVKEKGYPLTWLDYYAWKKGPVAREIFDIKHGGGLFSQFINVNKNEEGGKYIITPNRLFDIEKGMMKFSQNQIDLVDAVLRENGDADADSLTEITHKEDGLWASTVKKYNLSFEDDQQSEIKVDLISLIDKESEIYQDYIEAFDNLCFAASLNN